MHDPLRDRPRSSEGPAQRATPPSSSRRALAPVLLLLLAASCVYHQPVAVYPSGPSKFDRSWDAARSSAGDLGVTVTDVDRSRGTIHGYKGSSDVAIGLWQQADGSVRVTFNVRAPNGPDTVLADQLSHAFDRHMAY